MGMHEFFNACGSAVEAGREPRHLIAPLNLYPGREIAPAESFDAGGQALQPPGQAADDRLGA